MKKLCIFVVSCVLASALYATYPEEYPIFLRLLGFSKEQIEDLQYGRPIQRSLKERNPGEFGISAASVLDVPGYFVRDYYGYIENFRNLREFRAVGKFHEQPEMQDLAPLTFSPEELQAFADCRSNCSLNLTEEERTSISQTSNVEELYRTILLNRVRNYMLKGSPDSYLKDFPHLAAYFPNILEYVSTYPARKDRRIPDFFYWTKEQIGGKEVIQIRHVFSQRVYDDYVLVDHLVYSNQALIASAFVLHLIRYVDGGHPRTLIVYHGRNSVDSTTGRAPGADKKIFAAFRRAGEELEERYINRAYHGFPYALLPGDQR
jgi:hypothetical protein